MAASTVLRAIRSNTDAEFRLWGKAMSDQFSAGGLVKTSDTGQVDWTTVTRGSAGATWGYEIWRSDDAAGSIVNWYMKIEYGSNAADILRPSIWLTFGWASNGSGSLSGVVSTRQQLSVNTTTEATARNCNLAAGNNWIAMHLGETASLVFGFTVERTKDASLADENKLLVVLWSSSSTLGPSAALPAVTLILSQTTAYVPEAHSARHVIATAANAIVGLTVGHGLTFGIGPGVSSPAMCVVTAGSGHFGAAQNTVPLEMYGATHTYIVNPAVAGGLYTSSGNALTRFE